MLRDCNQESVTHIDNSGQVKESTLHRYKGQTNTPQLIAACYFKSSEFTGMNMNVSLESVADYHPKYVDSASKVVVIILCYQEKFLYWFLSNN